MITISKLKKFGFVKNYLFPKAKLYDLWLIDNKLEIIILTYDFMVECFYCDKERDKKGSPKKIYFNCITELKNFLKQKEWIKYKGSLLELLDEVARQYCKTNEASKIKL